MKRFEEIRDMVMALEADFDKFYERIWENMAIDEETYEEAKADTAKIASKLKINFKHDLTSWIGNEIMLGLLPLDDEGKKQAYFVHSVTKY